MKRIFRLATGSHIRIVLYLSELSGTQETPSLLNKVLFNIWLESSSLSGVWFGYCDLSNFQSTWPYLSLILCKFEKAWQTNNTTDFFNMNKHLSFLIIFILCKYSRAWISFSPSKDMVNRTLISQSRHICTFLASLREAFALKM